MTPSRKFSFFSSTTVTVTSEEIPVDSPPVPITVHLPQHDAATKIQSVYRAHLIRTLYKQISAANSEADRLQRLIQCQDTVDSIRTNDREKLRMNEALMGVLLKLDSVPGIDPTVREARRKVSHRIVGLQEVLDALSAAKVEDDGYPGWGPRGIFLMRDWDAMVEEMEERVCVESGGEEMERFCAQYFGFRCLQRFLRD
ncbi:hypothetical protein SLE2022_345050 [Rubroshorea leprosula]